MFKSKVSKILIISSVLVLIYLIGCIIPIYNDYKKNIKADTIVYITPYKSFEQVRDSLFGVLDDTLSFAISYRRNSDLQDIKCGRYELKAGMTNKEILRTFAFGWEKPLMLTIAGNVRGLEKLAGLLGKKLMADSAAFAKTLKDKNIAQQYGFNTNTFCAMFIPNTYQVYWSTTPEKFIERMNKEYNKFWTPERENLAKQLNLSKTEVSILASIVCEETNHTPEMPSVAGVYINRLKKGMKLDADPTVKFAHNNFELKRILYKHLKIDSPYNTYKYAGLPPGPITIPSIKGIDAVLNYSKHNYLYFCASEKLDGTHKFAVTIAQHNKNARAYQAAITRLKIK